jgi:stearoyl-CoA desaturase (delta-9 desaturase)
MVVILLFFILHWYFSLFMQTFLHHRYASHAAFTMSKFWERFFYLSAYITQGSSYVSPRVYAIMHRMHHAYADTEQDPHSPKIDKNFFIMMWRACQFSVSIFKEKAVIEPRFLKNLPDWKNLDIAGHTTWSRVGWMAIYVVVYILFAPSALWFLLLPIHILMVPLREAIINWFAHKYESVNFKVKNTFVNLFKVDLRTKGGAFYNSHHKNPSAANFGFRWNELDPTYFIMPLLNRFRVIHIHKLVALPPLRVH